MTNEQIVLDALRKGVIKAIGGGVMDVDGHFLTTTTDLYYAVRSLCSKGFNIQRIDSGGSPTWALTKEPNGQEETRDRENSNADNATEDQGHA